MQAMLFDSAHRPLRLARIPRPEPGPGQVLIRVSACGVCRTDLHLVDGELPDPKSPVIPGHEIIGTVVETGEGVDRFSSGQRVGVPWLGFTCGECRYCRNGQENLCDGAKFTGYQIDGGYSDYTVADQRYCFPITGGYSDAEAAPLLCAGLIGFGAAAHIIAQVAHYQGRRIFAFTRPGDREAQSFARELGAVWSGDSGDTPPEPLDAAILFAPVGALVPAALRAVVKGGTVVCAGIHMSDIPSFPYDILWGERRIVSVANLTRRDGEEFLALAPRIQVRTTVTPFPLSQANEALTQLRDGEFTGAAVLLPDHSDQ